MDSMYRRQAAFLESELERLYGKVRPGTVPLHHSMCTHLIEEAMELLACQPWHLHKKPPVATRYATTEEIVDCLKWLMNLMVLHGIGIDDVRQVFDEKSTVVEDRVRLQEFKAAVRGPILVLDLDGVACDRDEALIRWAIDGEHVPPAVESVQDVLHHVGADGYERLKFQFYEDQGFAECLPNESVVEALWKWPDVPVLVLTSRNSRRHPRLHYVTLRWLKVHNVRHDALEFAGEKDKALVDWVHKDSIAVDDDPLLIPYLMRVCDAVLYPTDMDKVLEYLTERRTNAS